MNRFSRRLLWGSMLATALTGFLYFWFRTFLEPIDEWAVIHHPLEPWVLKAHIMAAPVMVFALGTIAADHVLRYARSGSSVGRRSGLTLTALLVPLIATGYLLQVVTHSGVVRGLSWSHTLLGTVAFLIFAWHRTVRRQGRLAREERRGRDAPPGAELERMTHGPAQDFRPSDPLTRRGSPRRSHDPRAARPKTSTCSHEKGA